jgi:hypothetical protein
MNIMDELDQLEETIFREIKRTEKAMQDMNLREDTDRGMPRIDALNWVLNEILVQGPAGPQGPPGINATLYSISPGHDGWLPGTGNANMVIQGQDLSAINSNSIVLLNAQNCTYHSVQRDHRDHPV